MECGGEICLERRRVRSAAAVSRARDERTNTTHTHTHRTHALAHLCSLSPPLLPLAFLLLAGRAVWPALR